MRTRPFPDNEGPSQLAALLGAFAQTIVSDFELQAILEGHVQRIVEVLPVTGAAVTLISPTTGPVCVAASDDAALALELLQTELGEGPRIAAYWSGDAVSIPDVNDADRFARFAPRALEAGLAAVFSFSMRRNGTRIGVLDLYRDSPGPLDDVDVATALALADVTLAYILNDQARAGRELSAAHRHEQTMHDRLTGLPNRALVVERIAHALRRSGRSQTLVAALFVGLDGFKTVNDTYGHHVGDQLLIAVGDRITTLVRPGDTIARLSGDDFVVVCEELADKLDAEVVARRVVACLAPPFELDGVVIEISASVGCACAGPGEDDAELLIREADIAMYEVKRNGGASYQVVERREQHLANYEVSLARDLGHALGHKELRTEYQPLVRTSDGRVIGAEALLRWDHPVRGVIPPATVIALAERSGDIVNIGRWVLERACTDRHRWARNRDDDTFEMAVNISPHQLLGPGFTAMVADVLDRTGTDASLLTLEITEAAFVQDAERTLVVLLDLKKLGVRLALDDFGTGYSSLNYLRNFPVDVVKLDQSFAAGLVHQPGKAGGDKASLAVISAIIELAHRLELSVVSEGIETAEQRVEMVRLGGEYSQGFYFARPISADDLDHVMQAGVVAHLPAPLATLAS